MILQPNNLPSVGPFIAISSESTHLKPNRIGNYWNYCELKSHKDWIPDRYKIIKSTENVNIIVKLTFDVCLFVCGCCLWFCPQTTRHKYFKLWCEIIWNLFVVFSIAVASFRDSAEIRINWSYSVFTRHVSITRRNVLKLRVCKKSRWAVISRTFCSSILSPTTPAK